MENIVQGQWFGTSGADLGDEISQSLRFNNNPNSKVAYLQDSDITIQSTSTFSGWIKVGGEPGATKGSIFGASKTSTGSDSATALGLANDGRFYSRNTSGDQFWDNRFRDYSAWYHLVLQFDSSRNMTLFVNGVEQSSTKSPINVGSEIIIGRNSATQADEAFQGYMAAFYYVDGSILAPTSFGKYNGDGVWVPQDYTGSYGTNGFKLTFDSSQTNGIGHDSSGQGNHFTAGGIETTAISTSNFDNDIDYEDTPTKNYPTANYLSSRHGEVDHAGLRTRNSSTGNSHSFSATMAVDTGKWYWEIEVEALGEHQFHGIGRADDAFYPLGANPGNSANGGVNYFNTGTKSIEGSSSSYGASYTTGDILGVALNLDDGEITFYKNNTSQGVAATGLTGAFLPGFGHYNNGDANINFGQRSFVYTPPSGYSAINSSALTEPTIKNGKDHFDVVTYTGQTGDDDITGLNFQPDFVWIKRRDNSGSHILADSVRGVNKGVHSDRSDAEFDDSSTVKAFNSDGFTVGDNSQAGANGATYVAWCWKGGGTAVSKTAGTIDSSVSANTTAGFSIVSYTGNGTAGATVEHGLNSAPEMIFVKTRGVSGNWAVYHTATGETHALQLDGGGAASDDSTFWNDTAPGSSVFTLGTHGRVNGNGNTQIAYCWHGVEGFSKFGEYTGNGNSDGPFEYLGFRPAFLLVRQHDDTSGGSVSWSIIDSTRSEYNPAQKHLPPNGSSSESDSSSFAFDLLSNGFKARMTADNNANGKSILYAAFAENPFGGENTPPVTAR